MGIESTKYKVNNVFKTKEDCDFIIIERITNVKMRIKFLDKYEHEKIVYTSNIRTGEIKNPYTPTTYGIGYLGEGKYKAWKNSKPTKEYILWCSIMQRCYSTRAKDLMPHYKNVTVCDGWHNFQNFAKWYEENYPYHIKGIKFQLDKDLLQQDVENKIYSAETCVFLPDSVNSFLTYSTNNMKSNNYGVYWDKREEMWASSCSSFNTGERMWIGYFKDKNIAVENYVNNKNIQINIVKNHLRSLNYLSENIIQRINIL